MCARYTLASTPEVLIDALELEPEDAPAAGEGDPAPTGEELSWRPNYNIAPTTRAPVVLSSAPRRLALARFGLVPFWAKDLKIGARLLNARAETAATKPAFRRSFERKRCLVIADGYYEWKKDGRRKVPFCFRRADAEPFTFAGLWDRWRPGEGEAGAVTSFSILTGPALESVAPVHDRMPVIVSPEAREAWLDPDTATAALTALLEAPGGDGMVMFPVASRVGSVRENDPDLIAPLEEPRWVLP